MTLIQRPAVFDVMVTENLFGDILSDEASVLAGLARDAAVRLDRREAHGPRPPRPVRADPRFRAGHRRQGHRQSARHDPLRRDDAALVAGPARRGRGDRTGRHRRPHRRLPNAGSARRHRRRQPGLQKVGTQAMADAVVAALEAGRARDGAAPAARGAGPDERPRVVLYDTTLRDGTQREGPDRLAGGQDQDRPPPGRVRLRLHRRRLAGLEPQGRRLLRGRPIDRMEEREARRLRLDSPPQQPRRDRPQPGGHRRGRDAGRDHLRQELAAPRPRRPGRHAGREPGDGRRLGGLPRAAGRELDLRRRALLRRLQGRSRLRAGHPARRPRRRRPHPGPVRHQRRHADRRAGRDRSRQLGSPSGRRGAGFAGGSRGRGLGHPLPQRLGAGRGQLPGRGRQRRPPRPGHDQRLRRALRQRQPRQHPRRTWNSRPSTSRSRPAAWPS